MRYLLLLRQPLPFGSRILAAVIGGYALTALVTLALSLALPWVGVGQAESVLASTIASFLIYAAVIMGVCHARSALRALTGLFFACAAAGPGRVFAFRRLLALRLFHQMTSPVTANRTGLKPASRIAILPGTPRISPECVGTSHSHLIW